MKRPLVPVAISYAGGLVLADNLHPPVAFLFLAAFLSLGVACVLRQLRPYLLLPLVLALGWVNMAWRTDLRSPLDLRNAFGAAEIVTLRGSLWRLPEQRAYSYGDREVTRTMAWIEAQAFRKRHGNWQRATGRVLVLTPGTLPDGVTKGAEVEVTGVLGPPPGPEAPGLFDYKKYLSRQSIYFQLRALGAEDWLVATPASASISERFILWAKATLGRGVTDSGQPLLLLWSMTLGARSSLEHEDYEPFVRTGTMHIFAISGLHVALISWMLIVVLRWFRLPRSWCGLIALPLIWFYTGATGWQPSAVRAAIMTSVVIGGWAIPRPSDLVNSLCAAALIILAWDPQQLFGASFQLSFFVVLSIALLLPRIEAGRDALMRHDPLLPEELVPAWKRAIHPPVRWATNAVGISLAAWLGALPLTIYYFHLFNPVTLLANVLIVPLSSFALGCNMAGLVFGSWLWPATELCNEAAVLAMRCIVWLCDWWAGLRWGVFNVRSFSPAEVAAYYALLLGLFSGWLFRKPRCWWALAGAPVACAAWFAFLQYGSSNATLTILPAEGGLAMHVSARFGEMLVDCGKTNAVERLIAPFLQAQGINTLHGFLLSHGDVGHIGGAQLVERRFNIRTFFASPLRFRSPVYRQCIERFETSGALKYVSAGDKAGQWLVLHPDAGEILTQADAGSLVLSTSLKGTRVLLLPDLNRAGQEFLINRGLDVRADIVVAGLPDSGEPLCDALLERISPKLIIIGDSERPAFARAKPELVERLKATGAHILCTSRAGVTAIEFQEGGRFNFTTFGTALSDEPSAESEPQPAGQIY